MKTHLLKEMNKMKYFFQHLPHFISLFISVNLGTPPVKKKAAWTKPHKNYLQIFDFIHNNSNLNKAAFWLFICPV